VGALSVSLAKELDGTGAESLSASATRSVTTTTRQQDDEQAELSFIPLTQAGARGGSRSSEGERQSRTPGRATK
jgi:hypothetical protein